MKNHNQEHIEKLQQIIFNTLDPIIDDDYSLLDIPDYNNIGDNLIWEGELDYLSRLPLKKIYESNCWSFRDKDLPKKGMILLQGGGNFGDLYPESQNLKIHLIQKYIDRKIVIFPQSIHYNHIDNFNKDLKIFQLHPNLHICVRDQESYELLIDNGLKNIYLLPDMAFCINFSKFNIPSISTDKNLLMKRKDKELNTDSLLDKIVTDNPNVDVLDWPTFNISRNIHRIQYRKERYNRILSKKFLNIPLLNLLVDSRFGLKSRNQKDNYIKQGIQFLSGYDTIYTTRLHGLILAILLDKNVTIIDNKHKKLSRFYTMWLKEFDNVKIY